jgi:hypothetical protein
MSDLESDSDVSRYDPGDNFNMYGSSIYTEQPGNSDNVDEVQPGPSNIVLDRPNR